MIGPRLRLHSLKRFRHYDRDDREIRATDVFETWGLRIALVLICLMTWWVHGISGDVGKGQRDIGREQRSLDTQEAQLGNAGRSLVEGCQRLNQVRQSDNTAHLGTYTLFQFILAAQATTAQKQAQASAHLTPAQKALVTEEIAQIKKTTAEQSWTPLTNCQQAVATRGANYKVPAPISFSARMPPPKALVQPTTVRP